MFGPPDPFCLFAVLPMLVIAALFIWGGLAVVGVVVVVVAGLIVMADSWANRPTGRPTSRRRENY